MDIAAITPVDVLTIGGASIVVAILVGVIIAAWRPTTELKDRFGPLLALAVAILVTLGFAAAQGANLLNALLVGILVGGGSMGVHDVDGALGVSKAVTGGGGA